MEEIENINFAICAGTKMKNIASLYCKKTICCSERMPSTTEEDDCYWYHSNWIFSRLLGFVSSKDYFGEKYTEFFQSKDGQEISVLVCGLADYAILGHLLRRIPTNYSSRVKISVIDICNSPLVLGQWYISEYAPIKQFAKSVEFLQADATNLPFAENSFDLITTYSLLTRLSNDLSSRIVSEWHRVLRKGGIVLTSLHEYQTSVSQENGTTIDKIEKKKKAFEMADLLVSSGVISEYTGEMMKESVTDFANKLMRCSVSIPCINKMFSVFETKIVQKNTEGSEGQQVIVITAKK